ncbi:cobaltochelatase subunit [methanogenic archaeon mixed culture ISO4-G1]|nr:cobaltochelatase subunit [methanogenic archaeon mixed culture ISO4-G1]
MSSDSIMFPFVRVVGQEKMKKALLLNIVDPGIGGVLIKGEKGTAKSTTIRSLAQILPSRPTVVGCPYHCNPNFPKRMCVQCREKLARGETLKTEEAPMTVVELPLSATEDRVSGTLDLEHVLKTGEKKFEPGVLAQANGNVLYVDEVNLLDDHIIDLLLDSAAMGVNYIEREGVSFSHPAKFVLVGSMNPEEGSLRPQLLDRFGLCVDIEGEKDVDVRMEVIERRMEFDRDPEKYLEDCQADIDAIREKIKAARDLLPKVNISKSIIHDIVATSIHFNMEGHRADITMMRAAKANAALEGRTEVTKEDLRTIAPLVISHRLKKRAFDNVTFDEKELDICLGM